MMEEAKPVADTDKRGRNVRWLMLLLMFVTVVLTVQAVSYNGVVRQLGEWQFAVFGRYFPPLTVALILALVVIVWNLLRALRRRLRRDGAPPPDEVDIERSRTGELRKVTRAYRAIGLITLLAAGAFIGSAIHYLQLPGPSTSVATVDLQAGTPTQLREGSVRIAGIRPLGPVARFRNDVIFARQTIYLLPVGRTRLVDGSEAANLFVQTRNASRASLPTQVRGLLRTNALPPEVAIMYRAAGFPVADESAVVFANERFANHATLMTLVQLGVVTLVGALFALVLHRRRRRMAAAAVRPADEES